MVEDRESGSERLPRARRITRSAEIRGLFRRGKRERTAHLDVFHATAAGAYSRAGLVVPKHGNKIVSRNRLKRRLREIMRREVLPRLDGEDLELDVMVRARREAYGATYTTLRQELREWVEWRCSRALSSG